MRVIVSIIELLKYVLLGLVQGVTEVLPISSSGHVAIFQQILNIRADEGFLFLILINFGSLVSILFYFRKLILHYINSFVYFIFVPSSRNDSHEGFYNVIKIIIGIIPAAFVGYFIASTVDAFYQDHYLLIVGAGLLFTATVLYLVRNKSSVNGRQTITFADAFFIGVFQTLAIIPGISRSAITTSSGLHRKMSMETSLNFSFMLYIPLSIGSFLHYLSHIINLDDISVLGINPSEPYQIIYYFAAMLTSVFATWYSLKFMYILYRKGKLLPFALYTFTIGIIVFLIGIVTYI